MADGNMETPVSRKRRSSGQIGGSSRRSRRRSNTIGRKASRRSAALQQRSGEGFDLTALPDNVLLRVFVKAGYKARFSAMQVCKRFHHIATHPRFTKTVKDGKIMDTARQAKAGDTIIISPGLYDEMVLLEKPVKLVAQMTEQVFGGRRKGVVLQSSRSICVLSNARCCFQNIIFRTCIATTDRSVCSFGPECDYLRFDNCEFSGLNGLYLPKSAGENTQLRLKGCLIHSITPPLCGVSVETGYLQMEGCSVSNCPIGIDVHHAATVYLRNNDISFNESAMLLSGRGVVCDNVFWGNVKPSAIEVSIENLNDLTPLTDLAEQKAIPSFEEMIAEYKQKDKAAETEKVKAQGQASGEAPLPANDQQDDPPSEAEHHDNEAVAPANPIAGLMHHEGLTYSMDAEAKELPKRIHLSGNILKIAGHKRERTAEEAAVRRRIRQLAAMTYGAHEHGWHDIADSEEEWTDEDEEEDGDFEVEVDIDDADDDDGFDAEEVVIEINGDEEESGDEEFDSADEMDSDDGDGIDEWGWDADVGGWEDEPDSEGSDGMHTDDDLSSLEDAMDVPSAHDLPKADEDLEHNDEEGS